MLAPVMANQRTSPSVTAQFRAEGKCWENSFAAMSSEAISSKPEVRNRAVRMRVILLVQVTASRRLPAQRGYFDLDLDARVGEAGGDHGARRSDVAEILAQDRPAALELRAVGQDVIDAHHVFETGVRLLERRFD